MSQVTSHPTSGESRRVARRRRLFTWKRLLAGLVVLIVGMELFLRLAYGFGHPLLYQSDTACGYLLRPDQDITRVRCHNYINQHSMRSPEFAMPRPPGVLRVLCIGDSVTYGTTYVPQEEIFTSRLAAGLPAVVHQPVEVLNMSTAGWAPANEVQCLQSRGTFDANIVLMVWNTSDLDQPCTEFPRSEMFPTRNPRTALGEIWFRYIVPRISRTPVPADPGTLADLVVPNATEIAWHNLDLLGQAAEVAHRTGAVFGVVFIPSGAPFQTPPHIIFREQLIRWTSEHQIALFNLTDAFAHDDFKALTVDNTHLRSHGDEVVARELLVKWPSLLSTAGPASAGAETSGESPRVAPR